MTAPTLAEWLLEQITADEAVARAASGGTVTGSIEQGWTPVPTGDEWAYDPHADDVEVLVALRPNLHRPPIVLSGYWGQVAGWEDHGHDEDLAARPIAAHIALHNPARVLAECGAKRGIVADLAQVPLDDFHPGVHPQAQWAAFRTLRNLALPYADRPGYREEWRP